MKLRLSWESGDMETSVTIPISARSAAALQKKLGSWPRTHDQEEALIIMGERMAKPAGKFARSRRVPPSQHLVGLGEAASAINNISIPRSARACRNAMRDFLMAHWASLEHKGNLVRRPLGLPLHLPSGVDAAQQSEMRTSSVARDEFFFGDQ